MASFLLLGPLEVRVDGRSVPVNGVRQQVVLSLLLLQSGRVIPSERLITAVWDDDPPATARAQIQISISKLRALLARLGLPDAIVTQGPGYLIRVPEDQVDAIRFTRLVTHAREAARRQGKAAAVVILREALGLWRGPALAGIRSRLVQAAAMRLDEDRVAVTEERIDLELELGGHREVIGELRELVDAYPLREKLYEQLMRALYQDGRQADALEVYRTARRVLVEEHGLDPTESLRALERSILNAEPVTVAPAPTAKPDRIVPRQLPVRAKGFVGREETRRLVRQALEAENCGEVLVLSGPAGVGKTTLAVEIAYDMDDRFPDGQLFARLRGGDGQPVPPEQVLDYFLRALGMPPATLPVDCDALAGLYRSHLAGCRLLIVLDDAASARQVEPLLPAAPGVAMIVTSRSLLAGLPNARRFDLEAFSPEASRLLLAQVIGSDRVKAEPEATAVVTEACGHLPLALQIAAAKLSTRKHWRIARMASRLADESSRLDELSLDGTGVRASIAVSVKALSTPARRLLLLLGSLGTTDFTNWVAGPLLDLDGNDAADVLDELVDTRLAEVQVGTGSQARYRLHGLVAVFARELLAAETCSAERNAALHRLLRGWWHLVAQAHRRMYSGDFTVPRAASTPWPVPEDMVDELLADPLTWFGSEYANLVSAVRLAADLDESDLCCDLAVTLVTFFEARSHRQAWRDTHEIALEIAIRHGNRRAEAAVRYSRAGLALVEQRFTDAESDLCAALEWFSRVDDAHGRGLALRGLGSIDRLQGRPAQARKRYHQALVDLRESGDQIGEAHVLINLAQVVGADHGHGEQAEEQLRLALRICEALNVRRVAAQARYRLGQHYLDRGELGLAEAEFASVLAMAVTAEDPVGKAYALLGAGTVLLGRRKFDRAEAALTEALAMMRQTGSRVGEGRALLMLAELLLHAGDPVSAATRLREAEAAFGGIGAEGGLEQVDELRKRLRRTG